ncbi:hypothetical protein NC651_014153 [Populus alba x Populus x berolinensis]|nr:hypothetical protein NC651_014153 [Populus alba x Populus x berolinensis]
MSLWRASRTNRAAPAGAGLPLLARSVFNFVQPGNVLDLSYSLRDREVTAFLCSSLAAKLPATSKKQRGSRKMTTIRRFSCNDLLRFASVNFDHLTETFNMSFYMTYLARWPDYFHVAEGPGNKVMGYIMGKVEGQGESWHGHVTAVTVASEYRRQQLAKKLMNLLEEISDKIDKAYFVDLFVRASNTPAIKMYEKLGYVIYRRVLRYYSGEEDGLDMRKALSRDVGKKSIIPLKRPVTPDELEYD